MMRSIMVLVFLLQSGCTGLQIKKVNNEKKLSCEEEAEPKSLQYIEQQYRCSSEG